MDQEEVAGLVVKLAMESGSFQEGITALNRQMKVAESEFKAAAGGSKEFGDTIDGASANADRLSKVIGIQSDIVSRYEKRLNETTQSFNKNIQAQEVLKEELDATKAVYEESVIAIGKNAKETLELESRINALQKTYEDNNSKIRNNQKAMDNATISVNNAKTKLAQLTGELYENTFKMDKSAEATGKNVKHFNAFKAALEDNTKETKILGMSLSDLAGAFSKGGVSAGAMVGVVGGLTSALVNLAFQALQAVIAKMGELIAKGIELTGQLQEIKNVFDTTFGEDSSSVNKWADSVRESLGLTESQIMQFSSTFANSLQGIDGIGQDSIVNMSKNITQLTADFASFNNLKIEDSFEKFMSIITGQTEPLQKYGINMNVATMEAYALSKGIDKSWQSMSEAEKVTLRYNYVIERTSKAQGDFAKTSDSYANTSRTLSNTIDELSMALSGGFIDALGTVKGEFNDVLKTLTPSISLISNLVGTLLNWILKLGNTVIKPFKAILDIFNPIIEGIDKVITYTGDGVSKFIDVASSGFNKMGDDLEYTYEGMKSSTDESFGYMQKAADNYMNNFLREQEERLRKKYSSGSLASEMKIQRELEALAKGKKAEIDMATETEKKKTEILEAGLKDRQKLYMKRQSGSSSNVPAYAVGTKFHPGGMALVGENGPELINLRRGAEVINATHTRELVTRGASNSPSYHLNGPVTIQTNDANDLFNQIQLLCRTGAI